MPENEYGTGKWQLYDLSVDQGEVHDLAKEQPELVERLMQEFARFCAETGAVFGPPVRALMSTPPEILSLHTSLPVSIFQILTYFSHMLAALHR